MSNNRSIYVGDLARDVTEMQLERKFCAIGPVLSVKICAARQKTGKEALAHGFVNFRHRTDAQKALTTLHFQPMGKCNTPMRLMWYAAERSEESNLYLKNIEKSVDCPALHKLMAPFGNILSCKIAKDSRGRSLGHGFVQFETMESARKAIQEMNGTEVNGMELYVGKFTKKQDRTSQLAGTKNRSSGRSAAPSVSPSVAKTPETVKAGPAITPPSGKVSPATKGSSIPKSSPGIPDAKIHTAALSPAAPTVSGALKELKKAPAVVEAKKDRVVEAKSADFVQWPAFKNESDRPVVLPVSQEKSPNIFGGIGSRPSSQPARIHTYRDAVTVAPIIPEGSPSALIGMVGMTWLDMMAREPIRSW